jgi:RHS repeat-associated protein
MRRLIYILMLSSFLSGNLPSVAYALTTIADSAAQRPFKVETDDIAACADDPAPDMHGNNPGIAGKPVSLLSGVEGFTRTDLTIGNIFPISVSRRYDSRTTYDSPVGSGWAINYDRRLYTYPDGSVTLRKECGWKRRFSCPQAPGNCSSPIGESGILVKNEDGTFTYWSKYGSRDEYDISGKLSAMYDARGNALQFLYEPVESTAVLQPLEGILPANLDQNKPVIVAYNYRLSSVEEVSASHAPGAHVDFHYNSKGRLTKIVDSAYRTVAYSHDGIGNLAGVSGPAGTATYGYTDAAGNHRMTSVDEGQGTFTNTYDAKGWVTRQTHGTGQIDFEYLDLYKKTRITTQIKDSSGTVLNTQTRTTEFDSLGQPAKVTDTFGNVTTYVRDSNAWLLAEGDYDVVTGVTTTTAYAYDTKGNVLTKTEAQGSTAVEKTTTYTYHPVFNGVLTETVVSVVNSAQNRIITNTYDDTNGNLLTTTETGLLGNGNPYTYTTAYTYDANGKLQTVNGPGHGDDDIITYTYTEKGYLASIAQPLLGTTTYSGHDALGNPGTVSGPNGATVYTYWPDGKVKTVTAPGDTNPTQYFYVSGGCSSCGGANKIDHITLPEGNTITYGYDTMGNIASISDSLGNTINYTYDSEGNKLTEQIKDSSGSLQKSLSYTYDAMNRLQRIINPDSSYTEYAYDFQGNRSSLRTPNSALSTYSYDAMNRLTTVTQPGIVNTGYGYNSNNNLTSVTDANTNTTTYKYDDKGRVYQVLSPDTGTTTYAYDPAGNLISKTDAKGVTISYSYDALNRLRTIDYPTDVDTVYTYDTCLNGKGRLCSMADASGTTSYEYSPKGQVTKETKVIDSHTYITRYTYDQNGNVKTMTYPSGKVITYNYTNDRATSVLNGAANLATNIAYKPFGGMSSLTYDNGLAGTIGYDNQYRVTGITATGVMNLTYPTYDNNGNIKAIQDQLDPTKNKSFTYDALDRLSTGTASGIWGSLGWTYDGVGNRQTENENSYTYVTGSNKLNSANGLSYGYDNNGNTTVEGARQFVYNQNQRLLRVIDGSTTKGEYTYNGNGQRVKKVAAGATTIFHYSQNGQIIAESNSAGTITVEYVYLNGQPLAKMEGANTYYYHNDHLGTPQKMTDASGQVVWAADYKPFGEATVTVSTITNNLRFPGQYYDSETGTHYNLNRTYNTTLDRYIEADPIGIVRGQNHLYVYAQANPVMNTDTTGLACNSDGDCLKCIVYSEARGQNSTCLQAIAWTVKNRVNGPLNFSKQTSVCQVVSAKRPGSSLYEYDSYNNSNYSNCCNNECPKKALSDLDAVTAALSGLGSDPTGGAQFFRSDGGVFQDNKYATYTETKVPGCNSFRFFKVTAK